MCRLEQNEEFLNGNFARDKRDKIREQFDRRGGDDLNPQQMQDLICTIAAEIYSEEVEILIRQHMGYLPEGADMKLLNEISAIAYNAILNIVGQCLPMREIKRKMLDTITNHN